MSEDPRVGQYRSRVEQEEVRGDSPREDGDLFSTMVVWTYKEQVMPREDGVGGKVDLSAEVVTGRLRDTGLARTMAWLESTAGVALAMPVWMYWSSGPKHDLVAGVSCPVPHNRRADTVGVVYATYEQIDRVGRPEGEDWLGQVHAAVVAEVEQYSAWNQGRVFRYTVEQWDGIEWRWVNHGGRYFDRDLAQLDADAEVERLGVGQIERGDPDGVVTALRRARDFLREEIADLQEAADKKLLLLDGVQVTLTEHDPDHPMHVAKDAPHWHVQPHGEADVTTWHTIFSALGYAADEVERIADAHADGAAGSERAAQDAEPDPSREAELLREAFGEHHLAVHWYTVVTNAKRVVEQANAVPWERAPLYATVNEAQNKAKLVAAARHSVEQIADPHLLGFRIWECSDDPCEHRMADDE